MYIFHLILKGMWNMFAVVINFFIGIANALGVRAHIRQIEKTNRQNSAVEVIQEPQKVSQLIAGASSTGKTITTGDDGKTHSPWRNVITRCVVEKAAREGMGAIVLHNGDDDLVARLQEGLGSRVVVMDERSPRLDLICNLKANEIVKILFDEENSERYHLPESSFQYFEALLEMYEMAMRRMPSFNTIADMTEWNMSKVNEVLEKWVRDGYLETEDARRFQDQLNEFSDGRHKLSRYLNMIRSDLENVLAPRSLEYRERMTIRRALVNSRVLTIDIRHVHEFRPVLGMFSMLLQEAFSKCSAGLLVLDNISFTESERMKRLVVNKPVNLGVHLSMADLVASCSSDAEKLNTMMTGSQCCIVMRHSNGHSCELLSKRLGTYEHVEIEETMHLGRHRDGKRLIGGADTGKGYVEKKEIKPRVQAGQIEQQQEGVVYVTNAGSSTIRHCPLQDG